MTPERWSRVQALFEAALERPEAEREGFVTAECGDDDTLCSEVLSLLAADAKTDAMLDAPAAPSALDDPERLPAGTQLGEYVIGDEIGAGGFGRVYRAVHPVIAKTAAVKVLYARYSHSELHAQRFVNEARTVNEIGHPDIVDIFAFGETDDGCLYFVMELLDAPTLAERIRDDGPVSVARALPLLRRLGAAIDAAHQQGVVHRDLKPANILVVDSPEGGQRPKLLDFGIAKLRELREATEATEDTAPQVATAEGQILGTPAYMSPEQSRGLPVDAATDVYAFGVLVYEMLTGVVPFRGRTPLDTLLMHVNEAPPPPSTRVGDLLPEVDAVVLAMLAKAPSERPATCTAAIEGLAATVEAAVPTASRSRLPLLAVAVGGVVTAGVMWQLASPNPAAPSTEPAPVQRPSEAPVAVQAAVPPPTVVAVPEASPPPAPPELPADVAIEIVGPPKGTMVYDEDGNELGRAPGTLELPTSDEGVALTLRRTGYRDARAAVTPSRDQTVEVTMQRKPKSKLNPDLESPFKP